jgi:hypothetical protein
MITSSLNLNYIYKKINSSYLDLDAKKHAYITNQIRAL